MVKKQAWILKEKKRGEIKITSGYRTAEQNKNVGEAPKSIHLKERRNEKDMG